MAALPSSFLSCAAGHSSSLSFIPPSPFSVSLHLPTKPLSSISSPGSRAVVLVCSASSTPHNDNLRSKKSVIANLIQEIEPLDVSLIQKDVAATTVDAMKRTISGMLGLLPSDQFHVSIEALWEPLSKLLISSMMTGYTLRNAEYRLCLEKNLEIYDRYFDKEKSLDSTLEFEGMLLRDDGTNKISRQDKLQLSESMIDAASAIPDFGEMTPETQQYIINLQSRLSSVKRELHEVKRKSGALQMQQFVGEEKNDLLDYLRSLQPEKVAELSETTSPELKETIRSVVYGLLATLSPKMHSRAADLTKNTSIQFQPHISLTRDYLARLLFWCMLLGHYLRGLEYRLELMELLSLPYVVKNFGSNDDEQDV